MSPLSSTVDEASVGTLDPRDNRLTATLEKLKSALGRDILGSEIQRHDLWIRVSPSAWARTAEICRRELGFDYFCFLSAIDWMTNPSLSGEKVFTPAEGAVADDSVADDDANGSEANGSDANGSEANGSEANGSEADSSQTPGDSTSTERTTGLGGGDTRFQVMARYYSTSEHIGLTIKTDVAEPGLRIDSIVSTYQGADWHERETWEMFGIDFDGHPGMRHLYLPGEFEGHPLRKDFPLLAREVKPWPGLVDVEPIPGAGDDAEDAE